MNSHPLANWGNNLKQKYGQQAASLGMFLVAASPMLSECAAQSGIDWMAVDLEASPASRSDLMHIAQSLNGSAVSLFVRIAENNKQYIEAALDIGAHGVIIPRISSAAEAKAAQLASYYPPIGSRGLNPIRCSAYFKELPRYLNCANSNIMCIAQIETKEAINNLTSIAATPGLSGLFIGSGDLALEYGTPGIFDSDNMNNARARVLAVCHENKLIPGIFAYSNELAKQYINEGFYMIGIGNEIKFLQNGLEAALEKIRCHPEKPRLLRPVLKDLL